MTDTGAIAARQPSAAAPRPNTAVVSAPAKAHQDRGRRCGSATVGAAGLAVTGGAGSDASMPLAAFNAASTTSGVNGGCRRRTPVASKIALAIAAVPGTDADSPTPSAGSPGRGISSTSTTGTSRKFKIG